MLFLAPEVAEAVTLLQNVATNVLCEMSVSCNKRDAGNASFTIVQTEPGATIPNLPNVLL